MTTAQTKNQSEIGKEVAASLPRDAHGHFMKRGASPLSGIGVKKSVSGIGAEIKKLKSATEGLAAIKDTFTSDEPLVSVQVNNPFAKIIKWIDQIRRKQTTTFALKVSVPLVALPVALFTFFQLGRMQALNREVVVSRVGFLRMTTTNPPRYLLLQEDGTVLTLTMPKGFDPINLANRRTLVTGLLNQAAETMEVSSRDDVELAVGWPAAGPTSP